MTLFKSFFDVFSFVGKEVIREKVVPCHGPLLVLLVVCVADRVTVLFDLVFRGHPKTK